MVDFACVVTLDHYNVTIVTSIRVNLRMSDWLFLVHRIPAEPSAARLRVWRKMKRLGALLVRDGLWVLPATARTREQFQWLAGEIVEMKGEASVWEAQAAMPGQDEQLKRRFLADADAQYARILAELRATRSELAELSNRYALVRSRDYFHSPVGERARKSLVATRKGRKP